MAQNFNVDPYYDDYNEDKKFYRILFKPGVSVQARELTQLQTILQKQIERHGRAIYKEGGRVVNGEFGYTNKFYAVKLVNSYGGKFTNDILDQMIGKKITGATSGVTARVEYSTTGSSTGDNPTIYVTYLNAGDDTETKTFADNELLVCKDEDVSTFVSGNPFTSTIVSGANAVGASASIERGVYFVRGHFVLIEKQRILLSKYTNTPSARIGLQIVESVIDSSDDQSLLDPADGSPNYSARGADRYSISLVLTTKTLDSTDDGDFIELERVTEGRQQAKAVTSQFSTIGDELARRTYDESGDYIVRPYQFTMKENLDDGTNNGVYSSTQTTDDGNTPSEDLMTLQISAGKAYVQGYEIATVKPSFIDVPKARTYDTFSGSVSTIETGNYVRLTEIVGVPDLYETVQIKDQSGTIIGYARVKDFQSLTFGNSANDYLDTSGAAEGSLYRLFLFDIKTFTTITTSSNHGRSAGEYIRGGTSGATGYVAASSTGTTLDLTSSTGTFISGEQLFTSADNFASAVGGTVSAMKYRYFHEAKSITATGSSFSSTVVLDASYQLTGTVAGTSTTLTGYNTLFLSELSAGDAIVLPSGTSGALETRYIATVSSNISATLTSAVTTTLTSAVSATRKRAFIEDQSKALSLRRLPKDYVKTVIDNVSDITVKQQHSDAVDANNSLTFVAIGGTFASVDNSSYMLVAVDGSNAGKVYDLESSDITYSGEGTQSLTITSTVLFTAGDNYKLISTVRRTNAPSKYKTSNTTRTKVSNKSSLTSGIIWGTSAHHKEISLGVADTYEILAIYDSGTVGTDAVMPTVTVGTITGNYALNETIVGNDSGAKGYVVAISGSTISFVYLTELKFSSGELLEGFSSGASALISSTSVGSSVITNRYLLDSGQRDNFYDISKLVLKDKEVAPSGDILVVSKYFSHSGGDFFLVNSYVNVDYSEIPAYTATRIDPEIRNPNGIYDLRSTIDLRPRVGDIGTVSNGVRTVSAKSFDFASRSFTSSGSSKVSPAKDGSFFECDFEYYLPRRDSVFLTSSGNFVVSEGNPAELPKYPNEIENAMLLAKVEVPPYVIDVRDVKVTPVNHKRYTMKDIGLLENRLNNVEYYTSLSLLEQSANSLQIQDAAGFDRFKSGYVVDNFGGHKTGDVLNADYRCAVDMTERVLRPKFKLKNIKLEINETLSSGVVTTNDLVTLPYTEIVSIEQPYATRIENLNPVLNFAWAGVLKLSPSADEWFEYEYIDSEITKVEGNYDTIYAQNKNALGTVWSAPTTDWSGVESTSLVGGQIREATFANFVAGKGRRVLQRQIATETGIETLSGIQTTLVEQIDTVRTGERIVSQSLIPYMRENVIKFEAFGMKPKTKVYPFFDKVDVSRFCIRTSGSIAPAVSDILVQQDAIDSPAWTTINAVRVHYDTNSTKNIVFKLIRTYRNVAGTSDTDVISTFTHTSGNTIDRSVAEFNLTSGVSPNKYGEVYMRLDIACEDGSALPQGFQISQIQFFNENFNATTLLSDYTTNLPLQCINNQEYSEIADFYQFLNPQFVINGTNVNGFEGINYRSDNVIESEATMAWVDNGRRRAHITVRVRGGVRSINNVDGVERYVSAADTDTKALVTDAGGYVSGIFYLPDPGVSGNPKFSAGERLFRLTSDPLNAEVGVETFAQGNYTSSGQLVVKQELYTSTRNARIETREVSQSREVTRSRDLGLVQVGWYDPLAQSIMPSVEGGEFITSIEVFFASKDDDIPVTLQLRQMVNGSPTRTVLPFGSKTLNASEVFISQDASVPTKFTFDAPVYVKENVEICIVLMTDSPSYTAWISRMGETDIGGTRYVSEQPYLGVLFKSQNNSTWTAYDYEDLKFTVYRATFDISASGEAVLIDTAVAPKLLVTDPIECTAGSPELFVRHDDHHMYSTQNRVTISGVSSGVSGTLSADMSSTANSISLTSAAFSSYTGEHLFLIKSAAIDEINGEIVRGTISGSSITGVTRAVDTVTGSNAAFHPSGATIELYEVNGIELTNINRTHQIVDYGIDYYVVNAEDYNGNTYNATSTKRIGGSEVYSTENVLIDSYQLMVPTIKFPGTDINTSMEMLTGTSPSGQQVPFVNKLSQTQLVDRIDLDNPGMIVSEPNRLNLNVGQSVKVKFNLTSTKENLSPIIDLERTSISTYATRLDNITTAADIYDGANRFVPATAPSGDSSEAIYMTKVVQLQNPANSIKVYLDILKNSNSDVRVMYKLIYADDTTDLDEVEWIYFNTSGGSDVYVPPVSDKSSFKEHVYTFDGEADFIGFAIKIKMLGTNSAQPPMIKNLRAIALAT